MSDIIYTPPVVSGGGVNPTSTYMPVNINGSFVDSIFQCLPNLLAQTMRNGIGFGFGTYVAGTQTDTWLGDWNNQIDGVFLQVKNDTISSRIFTANRGFYLDYVLNRYIFGDWASVYNKTQFVIDDQNELIYTKNNLVSTGLSIDFNIKQFLFGSYGTGNLTYLSIEDSLGTITTKYQTNNIGLSLDFTNGNYFFGDFSGVGNGTYFLVQELNDVITTGNSIDNQGIFFNFNSHEYYFGDFNITNSGTSIFINDSSGRIYSSYQGSSRGFFLDFPSSAFYYGDYANGTYFKVDNNAILIESYFGGTPNGLKLDENNYIYTLGDYQAQSNASYLVIDNTNRRTVFKYQNADNGLLFDYNTNRYFFGDFDSIVSNTYIIMDATIGNQYIQFGAETLRFFGSGIQSPSAGGNSGEHLVIELNGNQYKIQLYNP